MEKLPLNIDVMNIVLSNLDLKSFLNFSATNKKNKRYFDDSGGIIWMNQMIKSFKIFGYNPLCINGINYKEITKEIILFKKEYGNEINKYQNNYDELFINLCKYGTSKASGTKNEVEIVKLLLKDPKINPGARDNEAFIQACCFGTSKASFASVEIVKLLLKDPRVDPSARNNEAFIVACYYYGRIEIVKILLNDHRVDPSANDNQAIILACYYGYLEIVKLLLSDSRVNLHVAQYNQALTWAFLFNHTEIMKLLEDYKKNN
jgi:hypothetical protein